MKYIIKSLIFLLSLATISSNAGPVANNNAQYDLNCPEKHIVVVIPSYNNEKWVNLCLDSVKNQDYKNFDVIYLNDLSKDKTGELVAKYIELNKLERQFTLINNTERVGALANLYKAIHSCRNDDIIVTLDGDDWLAHNHVLKVVNSAYQDKNVWVTYGQYKALQGAWWECSDFSEYTIKNNKFRYPTAFPSHLRTFYAGLFKLIKLEDLLYEGKFLQMTWDKAMMFPMIEMSGGKFKRIRDILYIYNDTNPINDHKVDVNLQKYLNNFILAKTPYTPVTWDNVLSAKR